MKFSVLFGLMATMAEAKRSFVPPKSKNSPQGKYVSTLMRGAKPTSNSQLRRLQENDDGYQVDLSKYSIKFQKCQFVRSYDDDLAADEDMNTVLATKRFVVFRLCADNSCNNCNYGYGEYLVDLETYLEATIEYQQEAQKEMCNACEENCQADDQYDDQYNNERGLQNYYYGLDCDSCTEECSKIENMADNGYVDATTFMGCQMLYDPDDDGKATLYAGPVCASSGYKIKIGVFTDEYCSNLDGTKDVDDYLMGDNGYQMKLSHALLKTTYADGSCVSCAWKNDNQDDDSYGVNEMCEQLYEESAKCESTHGFDNGYANSDAYSNQLAQEEMVCDFIDSIKAGSYDEDGEIVVNGGTGSSSGGTTTTSGQKFSLTFFVFGTVGLAVYAGTLHSKLTRGFTKGLVAKGGALA
jgi:hypothetical protein